VLSKGVHIPLPLPPDVEIDLGQSKLIEHDHYLYSDADPNIGSSI